MRVRAASKSTYISEPPSPCIHLLCCPLVVVHRVCRAFLVAHTEDFFCFEPDDDCGCSSYHLCLLNFHFRYAESCDWKKDPGLLKLRALPCTFIPFGCNTFSISQHLPCYMHSRQGRWFNELVQQRPSRRTMDLGDISLLHNLFL